MAAHYYTESPLGTSTFKWFSSNGGGWNNYQLRSSAEYSLGTSKKATEGVDTPNFRARKRRGELLPFTNFDQYESNVETFFGTYDYQQDTYTATTGRRTRYENDPGVGIAPSVIFKHGADQISLGPVIQSLASSASGWDALTFLAEAHRLRSMVTGLLTKFSDILRQRPTKFTVNQWLEYRYGWRVLYYDMLDISKAYESLKTKRKFSTFTSGDSKFTESVTQSGGSDGILSSVTEERRQLSFNMRARLIMKGEVNPIRINPLATSWELLKFSFVVDWFLDIGKAIDALSFIISGAVYVAGAGYKVEVNNTRSVVSTSLSSGYHFNQRTDGYSQCTGWCVTRSPASIPLRPFWNPRLTSGRFVDLIALVLQKALQR